MRQFDSLNVECHRTVFVTIIFWQCALPSLAVKLNVLDNKVFNEITSVRVELLSLSKSRNGETERRKSSGGGGVDSRVMAEEIWYQVVVPGIIDPQRADQSITISVPENIAHKVIQRAEFTLEIKPLSSQPGPAGVRGFVHVHPTRPTVLIVDVPYSNPKIHVKSIPAEARLPDSWKPVGPKYRGSPPWPTSSPEASAAA